MNTSRKPARAVAISQSASGNAVRVFKLFAITTGAMAALLVLLSR